MLYSLLKKLKSYFIAGIPLLATGGPSANVVGLPMGPDFKMDPYFVGGQGQIVNMTAHNGQTAYMECRVRNLGAKQVIWGGTQFLVLRCCYGYGKHIWMFLKLHKKRLPTKSVDKHFLY